MGNLNPRQGSELSEPGYSGAGSSPAGGTRRGCALTASAEHPTHGLIAQLVERLVYTEDVGGSSPSGSTRATCASAGQKFSSVRGMRLAPGAGRASVGRKSSLCTGASKCAICAPLLTSSQPETACVEGRVSAEQLARASSAKVAVRARFESAWMSVRYRRRWFRRGNAWWV